jgi:hypothetical protein
MKRENIGYLLAGFAFFVMMSMTINDAQNDARINGPNGIVYSIPAKPIATVYVRGTDDMYKYIKKGYQVQDVVGNHSQKEYHHFLMVKY